MPDVIATYRFRPEEGTSPEEAARWIAEEETTGTWTDVGTRAGYVRRLDGEVLEIVPGEGYFVGKIRYPAEIFEPGNIAQYLSVVAGNLFGLRRLASVRLLDMEFPESLVPFPGPKFGIRGIRAMVGTTNGPHVGTIIKPKVGLTPEDTAEVAYRAATGGVDL
ncbi:MAG: RuBisCO large subunit C-terminal-like domain-containing protein, partial [Methanomicrobiales archaeon]|nr:RuBisCO large subunit C-terminal-like domain-containing protein [Methanomicrobiales archaeon]